MSGYDNTDEIDADNSNKGSIYCRIVDYADMSKNVVEVNACWYGTPASSKSSRMITYTFNGSQICFWSNLKHNFVSLTCFILVKSKINLKE